MTYSNEVVGRIEKNFFICYDKVIIEYAPDGIDSNRICRVW